MKVTFEFDDPKLQIGDNIFSKHKGTVIIGDIVDITKNFEYSAAGNERKDSNDWIYEVKSAIDGSHYFVPEGITHLYQEIIGMIRENGVGYVSQEFRLHEETLLKCLNVYKVDFV